MQIMHFKYTLICDFIQFVQIILLNALLYSTDLILSFPVIIKVFLFPYSTRK